jgi:methyl-accepting chemotaxis protein
MKMNDAVETLSDNWEEWGSILNNSSDMSEEYSEAMDHTREAVADLLDTSKDFVSEDFIRNHLS